MSDRPVCPWLLPLAAIVCVAPVSGSPVRAQASETVTNRSLGLSAVKPAGWQILTADANAENLKRVFEDDPEFQAVVTRYASVPALAFTKYAEPYPNLNPSFKVNARPIGQLAGRTGVEIVSLLLPSLARAFPDAKIIQEPIETVVAGHPAGYTRINYTLTSGDQKFPTTSELWIVALKNYFLMIGAGTRQDEANGTRAEIQAILSSLKLDSAP